MIYVKLRINIFIYFALWIFKKNQSKNSANCNYFNAKGHQMYLNNPKKNESWKVKFLSDSRYNMFYYLKV